MAYEVYNVRVKTLDNQDMGTAKLYFGLNHARGAGYYWGASINAIQTAYRSDTGVTMDLNGLFAYSVGDPVPFNNCNGWTRYCVDYIHNLFYLPPHTDALKYVFKNGSFIIIGPVSYNSSENMYTCSVTYYVARGQQVLTTVMSCRVFEKQNNVYLNCTLSNMPWKGYASSTTQYAFTRLSVTGNGNQNFVSVDIGYIPVNKALAEEFFNGLDPDDPNDPYPDDDSGDDDGGEGDLPTDDPIDVPDIPDVSVTDTGFVTLYNPTLAQVRSLASYMWSGLFDIATFKKLFADPMDCIIGFNILPVSVPSGADTSVKIGNIDTGVTMPPVTSQWIKKSCGTISLAPIHDSYMDFAPYTKWSIYLPYIGIQSLSADDVAHKSLTVEYIIDVLTCACIAFIKAGSHVLYQFSGTCGYTIPFTSESFSRVIGNLAQLAVTVGGAVATGGASAPLNVGVASSVMNNVTNNKPEVHRSGALGGSAGIMGIQTPYLIIEYPNLCKPSYQSKYLGYPSFITKKVGDVGGYTEWESVILNGIPCTDAEREEILEVMKGGCYV